MTVTTEAEILDRMRREVDSCIADCSLLAKLPAQGPTFVRMRASLKAIENCCRQMAAWREDTRWLPMGIMMEMCHQKTKDWIVGRYPRAMFLDLQDKMMMMERGLEVLATAATGRTGMILPEPLPLDRETKPVSIILPHEVQ